MKRYVIVPALLLASRLVAGPAPKAVPMAQMNLYFEPNRGQAPAEARFVSESSGFAALLTGNGFVIQLAESQTPIRIEWAGARPSAPPKAIEPTGGIGNYYLGNDPGKWIHGVPHYARVRYDAVYPGID